MQQPSSIIFIHDRVLRQEPGLSHKRQRLCFLNMPFESSKFPQGSHHPRDRDAMTFTETEEKQINDRVGFFTDATLPDSVISDNDIASYYLFAGSDGLMNDMIDSQWKSN